MRRDRIPDQDVFLPSRDLDLLSCPRRQVLDGPIVRDLQFSVLSLQELPPSGFGIEGGRDEHAQLSEVLAAEAEEPAPLLRAQLLLVAGRGAAAKAILEQLRARQGTTLRALWALCWAACAALEDEEEKS